VWDKAIAKSSPELWEEPHPWALTKVKQKANLIISLNTLNHEMVG